MFKKHGISLGVTLAVVLVISLSCGKSEEPEPEPVAEPEATPEMVENVKELEAEIRRVEEAEGEAAACKAVEEAEEMIFMATEVAWLHRNPGEDLRPAYQKAVAENIPMTEVFDFEAGEGSLHKRYAEWDKYDQRMVQLKTEMVTSVSGQHRARSLDAICEISETNPHGFALVSNTLNELSGEMNCSN